MKLARFVITCSFFALICSTTHAYKLDCKPTEHSSTVQNGYYSLEVWVDCEIKAEIFDPQFLQQALIEALENQGTYANKWDSGVNSNGFINYKPAYINPVIQDEVFLKVLLKFFPNSLELFMENSSETDLVRQVKVVAKHDFSHDKVDLRLEKRIMIYRTDAHVGVFKSFLLEALKADLHKILQMHADVITTMLDLYNY